MTRTALSFIALLLALTGGLAPARDDQSSAPGRDAAGPELVIFNWEDYLSPTAIRDFESEFGARVRQVYFETDDARDQAMAASEGAGFDLLLLDNTALAAYRKRGWISPLDPAAIPNRRYLDPRWATAFPDSQDVAVPYLWGTMGIAYRRDLTGRDLDSWLDLLRPAPALRGRILMVADHFDLFAVALKALWFSMNSTDGAEIKAAADLLRAQRPAVLRYGSLTTDAHSELLTGRVAAAVTYNGDAAALRRRNAQVVYVIPREGGALWLDFLAIAAHARHPALAAAFLDFINRPAVAARNAQDLAYATANLAAERILPAQMRHNPLIYPDAATLGRCESYTQLPASAMAARLQAYAALMHGD
ncbi:spermidine/putrescine ABC transporter substrate-binding protein [uncultured Thiodictyon sp.]|uniref:polyamine ABC transporter substrate-binding protein n=1 Tax=uncultured Thiodictyon sp. TaxID=1846217 RepID=UPI0025D544AA|nr:spermidine/putrescine ABC transporter substrate-binding protein [uncultured Thiodictyon sp.]